MRLLLLHAIPWCRVVDMLPSSSNCLSSSSSSSSSSHSAAGVDSVGAALQRVRFSYREARAGLY